MEDTCEVTTYLLTISHFVGAASGEGRLGSGEGVNCLCHVDRSQVTRHTRLDAVCSHCGCQCAHTARATSHQPSAPLAHRKVDILSRH